MCKNRPNVTLQSYEDKHNTAFPDNTIKVLYKIDEYVYFETEFGICRKVKNTFGVKSYDVRSALNKTEFFINKSNKLFNFKYDYSKTIYVDAKENITIRCPIHGYFEQSPNRHLSNSGCNECGKISTANYQKNNSSGFTKTGWWKNSQKSKLFDSFKVYIIKCWNETEEFYKIGITFLSMKKRFDSKNRLPYNWEIINLFEFKELTKENCDKCYDLEKELQKVNKENKYTPLLMFGGNTECFLKIKI